MSDSDVDQQIRERAYQLWEEDGRPEGRDQEYWHRARAQIASDDRKVDTAMEDTFPASDPPAHSGVTGPNG